MKPFISISHFYNTDNQSKNELGPRPIHWACVNGHISVVDILLQSGVNIDTVDNKVTIIFYFITIIPIVLLF